MASEKVLNYTEDQTVELVNEYKASPTEATVKLLAERMGKTTRSIVAKLSREGVYQPKTKAKGAKTATKADLVKALESHFEMENGTLESLEKGSKEALEALVAAVLE